MATITVGTNSYVTEAELTTYAGDRGITIVGGLSVLLIHAMDYLESRAYAGYKTDEEQALQFPRGGDTIVPQGIKNAQCIAAIEIDKGNDLQESQGQIIKREKVGVLETEYADYSQSGQVFTKLNDALRPFIDSSTAIKVART